MIESEICKGRIRAIPLMGERVNNKYHLLTALLNKVSKPK